ncbi:MAG: hypothetical protein AMXMBFR33_73540 [Candidatus Xenobia bacterium]
MLPIVPFSAARPARSHEELTRLAREVVDSGASIEARESFLVVFKRNRKLEPEEAARRLDEPLQVRLPGLTPQPLQGPDDLRELAVFQKVLPPSELSEPDLAAGLQQLADQGWRFHTSEGEVGMYGAFNALSQVRAVRGEIQVELARKERVLELGRYGAESPWARLEADGYQFFDGQGRLRCGFDVQKDAQAGVGRDGDSWIKVGDPATLDERVGKFQSLLERLPQLELARQVYEQAPLSEEAAKKLNAAASSDQKGRLAPVLASELADRSTEGFARAGLALAGYGEPALQRAWLEELARRPESEQVGKLAGKIHLGLQDEALRYYVCLTALEKPDDEVDRYVARLYDKFRSDESPGQKLVGQAVLDALSSRAGYEDRVAALRRWQSDPNLSARALVKEKGDLRKLAVAATAWSDQKAQRAQLEEQRGTKVGQVALKAFDAMSSDSNRYYLWKAALEKADASLADFGQTLYGELRSQSDSDQKALGRVLIEALAAEPAHADAATALQRWQTDPNTAARALVKHSGDLRALAVAATGWQDQKAQRVQLEELAHTRVGQVALKAFDAMSSDSNRYYLWKAAMEKADASLAEFGQTLYGELRSQNDSDQKALGRVLIDALASEPAHASAATAVQRWQADPNTAARALVKHSGNLRALAVAATGW